MKIIATSEELKDLRNLFIQGFTSLDDKDREQFNKEVKRLNHIVSNKDKAIKELQQANNDLIYKLNQNRAIVTRLEKSNNSYENELKELIDKLNKKQAAETILEDRIKQLFSSDNAHKSEKQKLQSTNRELEQTSKNKDKIISELETKIQDLESDPRLSTGFDDFIEGFKEDVQYDLKKELEILKANTKDIFTMPQDNSIKGLSTGYNPIANKYISAPWINDFKKSGVYGNPLNLELQKRCTELSEKNKELVAEYESLEQKKINLEVENENLNSELNDIKQVLKQSNVELKDELNLKNEVLELQSKVFKLQETNDKLNQANQKLSKERKDLLILNDLSEADIKRHCNRNEELNCFNNIYKTPSFL